VVIIAKKKARAPDEMEKVGGGMTHHLGERMSLGPGKKGRGVVKPLGEEEGEVIERQNTKIQIGPGKAVRQGKGKDYLPIEKSVDNEQKENTQRSAFKT